MLHRAPESLWPLIFGSSFVASNCSPCLLINHWFVWETWWRIFAPCHMFLVHRGLCIECFLRFFCKHLVRTWSASFSHSSGAISCFWNAFRIMLGDVSLSIRLMAAFGLTLSVPLELLDWSWSFVDSADFGADYFSAAVAAFFFSCICFFPLIWLQLAPEFSA